MYDFSYTQYEADERVARVSEMYDECEKKTEDVDEEGKEECEMAGTARPIWNGDNKYLVTMIESGHQIKDEVQNKKQKVNATDANLKDNNERTKASPAINSHSPKRTNQLARKTVRSSPLKHGVIVAPKAKNGGTVVVASHGGIVKPFKAPTRVPFKTSLDVKPVRGQKFTSLKNLEAAKYEREKNKGKTKM
ncbi:hypothetical protein POM88_045853 [Heracleum sosnowskyi]|uniref:Uncharacterized protein n=1 Tax=Heracleum sosnowskyi TaxID=360622 RepID=A0AAD8H7Z1_9APIA|nr:hypothetical protein POM88_045853 [Heracleum sosnowskyi]